MKKILINGLMILVITNIFTGCLKEKPKPIKSEYSQKYSKLFNSIDKKNQKLPTWLYKQTKDEIILFEPNNILNDKEYQLKMIKDKVSCDEKIVDVWMDKYNNNMYALIIKKQ